MRETNDADLEHAELHRKAAESNLKEASERTHWDNIMWASNMAAAHASLAIFYQNRIWPVPAKPVEPERSQPLETRINKDGYEEARIGGIWVVLPGPAIGPAGPSPLI